MELKRFETLVEAWGADPDRWPPGERAAALALAARDGHARARLHEAMRLDRALRQAPSASISEALAERVTALAPQRRQTLRLPWFAGVGLAAGLAGACWAGAAAAVATHDRVDRLAAAPADPAGEAARALTESGEP